MAVNETCVFEARAAIPKTELYDQFSTAVFDEMFVKHDIQGFFEVRVKISKSKILNLNITLILFKENQVSNIFKFLIQSPNFKKKI